MSNLTTPRTMTLTAVMPETVKHLKELTKTVGLCHVKITDSPDLFCCVVENYNDNDLFHLGYFAAAKAFGKL